MSTTIDSKVVEMKFDNRDFESNVKTSMSTLDKLKEKLNFGGATKGLENVSDAAKNVNMSPLGNAVQQVHAKFSALEILAITALTNIANSAVDTGKKLVKSLTVEPIAQGFSEYELKMNSVQTIMASTGESIDTVNRYLDELNTYADKTIYSFSDMTSNIGKFTNAGVSLNDAVKAIQGISNEAAVSGANTNEASRAMYNFAQALSAGAVKLVDWKSIENANMATVEFKQQLIDTAVAMGTLTKEGNSYISTTTDLQGKTSDAFTATSMFNESLSHQWMTTDVLVQALSNYSTDVRNMTAEEKKAYEEKLKSIGYTEEQIKSIEELGKKAFDSAQDVKTFSQLMDTLKEAAGSGWATTFEMLFGNLEEAKKLWTNVSKVVGGFIDRTSDARNAALKAWKDMGGRQRLIDALSNAFDGLMSILKPISEAFKEVFPPITAKTLMSITDGIYNLTSKFKITDSTASKLKNTFKGLFTIFKVIGKVISALLAPIGLLFDGLGGLGSIVVSVTGFIGDAITEVGNFIDKTDIFNTTVDGIIEGLINAIIAIKKFASTIAKALNLPSFDDVKSNLSSIVNAAKEKFNTPGIDNLKTGFEKLSDISKKLKDSIVSVITKIKEFLSAAKEDFLSPGWEKMSDAVSKVKEGVGGLLDKFKITKESTNSLSTSFSGANSAIYAVKEGFKKASKTSDEFNSSLDDTSVVSRNVKKGIQRVIESSDDLSIALEKSEIVSSNVSQRLQDIFVASKELAPSLESTGELAQSVSEGLQNISKKNEKLPGWLRKIIDFLSGVVGGIGAIIKNLATELANADLDSLSWFTESIAKLGAVIVGGKLAKGFNNITDAIKNFSSPFKTVADNLDKLTTGIIGPLNSLRDCLKAYQTQLRAGTLIKIGVALLIFTAAVAALATVAHFDMAALWNGIGALTILLSELIGAMKLLENVDGQGIKGMLTLIAMAIAAGILAGAVNKLAKEKPAKLVSSVLALNSLLAALVLTFDFLDTEKKGTIKAATGLILMAYAVRALVPPIKELGATPLDQLAKGVGAVSVILAMLTAFTRLGEVDKKMLPTGMGIMAIAKAINWFIPAIKTLGEMDIKVLIQGEVAITALIAALAGFTYLAKDAKNMIQTSIAMVVMAGALYLIAGVVERIGSLPLGAVAVGLSAVVIALAALAAFVNLMPDDVPSKAAGLLVMAAALEIIAVAIGKVGALGWKQMAIGLVGLAASLLVLVIAVNAMNGALAGAAALLVVALAMVPLANALKKLGSMNIKQVGIALIALAGALVIMGAAGILLGPVAPAIIALAMAFKMFGAAMLFFGAGVALVGVGLNLIVAAFAQLVVIGTAGAAVVVAAITIIVTGVLALIPQVIEAFGNALVQLAQLIVDNGPLFQEALATLLSGLVLGFFESAEMIAEGIVALLVKILEVIDENIPVIVEHLVGIVTGFISGVGEHMDEIINSGFDLLIGFITGWSTAIDERTDELIAAMEKLFDSLVNAGKKVLTAAIGKYLIIGGKIMNSGLIKGIGEKLGELKAKIGTLMSEAIAKIKEFIGSFLEKGREIIASLIRGISEKAEEIKAAVGDLVGRARDKIDDFTIGFYNKGVDLIQGLINGVGALGTRLYNTVSNLAQSALNALTNVFNTGSPSKETRKIGKWFSQGLVNGIMAEQHQLSNKTTKLGQTAIDSLKEAISDVSNVLNGDLDSDPVIRPVVDLSEVQNGVTMANKIVNGLDGSVLSGSMTIANSASRSINAALNERASSANNTGDTTNNYNYNYTQNNNSPKYLSRFDIYRQTKNLLRYSIQGES